VVRRTVEDFNKRVVEARRQLQGGPPVVTKTRDVDEEVERWRGRLRERMRRRAATPPPAPPTSAGKTAKRRWFRRSS
jgi:hypothetical protein